MLQWLRRLRTNLILSLPSVKALFRRADRAIEQAVLTRQAYQSDRLMADELELQQSSMRTRMNEMLAFRLAEAACVNPDAATKFAESYTTPADTVSQFKERLWELELALEDRGWQREIALSNIEFSRLGVQQLSRIIRIMAIKNPLIKRGAEIVAMYVFGRGVEIRSDDATENTVIQDFLQANARELGHTGLASKERSIQTDGAIYIGMVTDDAGKVKVQMIDAMEVMDVITDPDDTSSPRYFSRSWSRWDGEQSTAPQPMKAWYPALEYVMEGPATKPDQIRGVPVNWDMPVFRFSGGACPANWRWPVAPLYGAVDWATAYKQFLEDWATIQRALSRFALMVETKGGAGAIAAYNALLNTTFANADGTMIERNPPPVTGAAHISGPDNTIKPFQSANATTAPEQARRLLLMVASSEGMPETFFGDASTGSLATAQSLDRPTELKFREIQQRWTECLKVLLRYVLWVAGATPGNAIREARKRLGVAPNTTDEIIVKFPAVLEHDPLQMIQAWSAVSAMGGRMGIPAGIVDRRTVADGMLAEVGYEQRSQLLDKIYGKNYDPAKDVTDQRTQVPPQSLKVATGKPLSDLSIAPPNDPPPAPPPTKPIAPAPPPAKESLEVFEAALDLAEAIKDLRNGRHG